MESNKRRKPRAASHPRKGVWRLVVVIGSLLLARHFGIDREIGAIVVAEVTSWANPNK